MFFSICFVLLLFRFQHESHAKAKIIPFKEAKKKQDRLESTADSEYMDAQDEVSNIPLVSFSDLGTCLVELPRPLIPILAANGIDFLDVYPLCR